MAFRRLPDSDESGMEDEIQPFESKSVSEVGLWLKENWFSQEVVDAFKAQEVDGDALSTAFSVCPGPDSLKDILPIFGQRLKVYRALKVVFDAQYQKKEPESVRPSSAASGSTDTPPLSQQPKSGGKRKRLSFSPSPPCSKSPLLLSTKIGKKSKLPTPFPIPQFRQCTQDNLNNERFNDTDRKHIVSVLGTVTCAYVQKASMKDCLTVAEALVAKYQFLKEPYSWQQFIYQKCQNINRAPSSSKSSESHDAKRPRIESSKKHMYPSLTEDVEDEVSNERNKKHLEEELEKARPSKEKLTDLMKRTFPSRRTWILDEAKSVEDICMAYPLLKKYSYLSLEFDLVMKQSDSRDSFDSLWSTWSKAIVKYARATSRLPAALKHALRDCPDQELMDDACDDVDVSMMITALRCLAYFLMKKKGVTDNEPKDHVDIPYILWEFPRGTPPGEMIDKTNNQPFIVRVSNEELSDQFFIVIEQKLDVECPDLQTAIFILFAVHYVYNIQYNNKVKDVFQFFEEKIMAIPTGHKKTTANYASFTAAVECYIVQ